MDKRYRIKRRTDELRLAIFVNSIGCCFDLAL